jgi:hypothetical protein
LFSPDFPGFGGLGDDLNQSVIHVSVNRNIDEGGRFFLFLPHAAVRGMDRAMMR